MQQVNSYSVSAFGAISTPSEANQVAEILKTHQVSGVEYGSLYYHQQDIAACISVADAFQKDGIDLWLSSGGLQAKIHAFNNDVFPSQYRARSLTADGSIVPATVWSLGSPDKVPAFDAMNPEAMLWFLASYRQTYLEPMKPYTSGYFFDEDCLYYAMDPGYQNGMRINYYDVPAYSDAVLSLWQKYCVDHSVAYNGTTVSKFPVHSQTMVPNGGGKTEYFPGYNVPETVKSGTAIVLVPKNAGVWAAWDDFVTSQYVGSWMGGISDAVYDVNRENPNFKGVIYFGLHTWGLGYEEVNDPAFRVDSMQVWVPWGTQRGVRLSKICSLPHIDYVVCETFPPIRANLYKFASEYKRIIGEHGKIFGIMLHRDDNWGLDGWDAETDRWAMIQQFQPAIIARYPINRLYPDDAYNNKEKENLFDQRMAEYRPVKPSSPAMLSPVHQASNVSITPSLIWSLSAGATRYRVQVATDSSFSNRLVEDSTVASTSCQVGPLTNDTRYYWRVSATNIGGTSAFSPPFSFSTVVALPAVPTLSVPADSAVNLPLNTTLIWNESTGAAAYHLQVSTSSSFANNTVDDTTITATSKAIGPLSTMQTYFWRVRARNTLGFGPYSIVRNFKTGRMTSVELLRSRIPTEYGLSQNYPNPFNPSTTIHYDLPRSSHVTLSVFNTLGQQLAILVNADIDAGYHEIQFNANNLASGVNFYRIQAGDFVATKKLLILR